MTVDQGSKIKNKTNNVCKNWGIYILIDQSYTYRLFIPRTYLNQYFSSQATLEYFLIWIFIDSCIYQLIEENLISLKKGKS